MLFLVIIVSSMAREITIQHTNLNSRLGLEIIRLGVVQTFKYVVSIYKYIMESTQNLVILIIPHY